MSPLVSVCASALAGVVALICAGAASAQPLNGQASTLGQAVVGIDPAPLADTEGPVRTRNPSGVVSLDEGADPAGLDRGLGLGVGRRWLNDDIVRDPVVQIPRKCAGPGEGDVHGEVRAGISSNGGKEAGATVCKAGDNGDTTLSVDFGDPGRYRIREGVRP